MNDTIVTSVMFLSFIIVTPHWYLNRGPLDLQSNTLTLCHQGQSYIEYNFTLIIFFIIHNYDPQLVFEPGTFGSSVQHSTTVPPGTVVYRV